jgi:hypothetical protein
MLVNWFNTLCNTYSFKEHLLEDGHNRLPKHVVGYADYNTSTYQYVNLLVISHKKCTPPLIIPKFSHNQSKFRHVSWLATTETCRNLDWLCENFGIIKGRLHIAGNI